MWEGRVVCERPGSLSVVCPPALFLLLPSALEITVLWNVGVGRLVGTSLYYVDVGFAVKR